MHQTEESVGASVIAAVIWFVVFKHFLLVIKSRDFLNFKLQ
jgi:hypothetical protein